MSDQLQPVEPNQNLCEIFEQKFKENFNSEFENTSGFKKVNVCYLHDFFEAGCEARRPEIDQLQAKVEQLNLLLLSEDHQKMVLRAEWHLIWLGKEKIQQILLNAPDQTANAYFLLTEIYIRGKRVLTNPIQVGGITNHFIYEYWNPESKKWIEALAATGHEFNFVYSFKELQLAIAEPQEAGHD